MYFCVIQLYIHSLVILNIKQNLDPKKEKEKKNLSYKSKVSKKKNVVRNQKLKKLTMQGF